MMVKRRTRQPGRKSGVLAVRVSPETRYRAELLALLHQRSVSEVIEIALARLAAQPESQGGAVIVRPVEVWDGKAAIGTTTSVDLVQETWDHEDWARRLKLAFLHPESLPPEERSFWQGILRDPENFEKPVDSLEIPPDIEFEEDRPVELLDLVFERPNPSLRPFNRALIRAKWDAFRAS